jgi:hypothetical protein
LIREVEWESSDLAAWTEGLREIATHELFQTFHRFADGGCSLGLRAHTVDQHYYFATESLNENGVSPLSDIVRID